MPPTTPKSLFDISFPSIVIPLIDLEDASIPEKPTPVAVVLPESSKCGGRQYNLDCNRSVGVGTSVVYSVATPVVFKLNVGRLNIDVLG
jgi:hypothetical protein